MTTAVPANFGGGAGDRSEIENSVIEKTPEILTVFPNPNFGEMLFVNAENLPEENVRVLIINTLGEVFRTWRIENWLDAPLAIPLENLAAGTYYLSMETKMGATRTARFVIVSTEK